MPTNGCRAASTASIGRVPSPRLGPSGVSADAIQRPLISRRRTSTQKSEQVSRRRITEQVYASHVAGDLAGRQPFRAAALMAEDRGMDPVDNLALAQLLAVAALLAGTCEYGEIIKRREERRQVDRDELATAGLIRHRLERLTSRGLD